MLRLVSDADFNGIILRGLIRRRPQLDLVRVQDVGLRTANDPTILEWAANEQRILLTHDEETMIGYAYARVRAGLPMPGVFLVPQDALFGRVIDDVLLADACSNPDDWRDRVTFLPF
jgi:Domain of unknown function (DUF5615)